VSISAVVGRIDQIMQLQQQILDPASLAGSSAASGSASTGASFSTDTGGMGAGSSSDFASTLANAQSTTGSTASSVLGSTASGVVGASGGVGVGDPRVTAMVNEADALVGKPYVYGGGHSGWGPQTGYDCSGFVSAVLHAGGYLTSPVDTTALPSQPGMVAGPGQSVTVYDRALPGQSGHVIIDINGQFYESGGMHGAWGGGGGVQKIATPSAAYLATFPTVLHPEGL
jgi:cell wall-associated NlpC family hydrolase